MTFQSTVELDKTSKASDIAAASATLDRYMLFSELYPLLPTKTLSQATHNCCRYSFLFPKHSDIIPVPSHPTFINHTVENNQTPGIQFLTCDALDSHYP
jgi:hypothetical protein